MFLPPVSVPEAAPEHRHPPRQAGAEALRGMAHDPTRTSRSEEALAEEASHPARATRTRGHFGERDG